MFSKKTAVIGVVSHYLFSRVFLRARKFSESRSHESIDVRAEPTAMLPSNFNHTASPS